MYRLRRFALPVGFGLAPDPGMARIILACVCLCILAFPAFVRAATWHIDPDRSSIRFKVRYMMFSDLEGRFERFKGSAVLDDRAITRSRVHLDIDVASVTTGDAERDADLRSVDFFDVARYPAISFISRQVERAGDGRLRLRGDLTAHGVTRVVVLDVKGPGPPTTNPQGKVSRRASATGRINRKDFDLIWKRETRGGDSLIDDEVGIMLEIELIRGK